MRVVDPALDDLRNKLLRMGSLAEAILDKALTAVWKRDRSAAREVQIDDLEIDRLDLEVDEAVLRLLATQAPVADDLRGVIAAKMIATDLERVGDLARNVAKCALRLAEHPEVGIPPRLRSLGDDVQGVLHRALDSFADADPERAAQVLEQDDQVDADQDVVVVAAIQEIMSHPELTSQGVDFILIAKNLERIADHATNVAEDVILATQARNVKHAAKFRT
jgi:phosphate transport system protein